MVRCPELLVSFRLLGLAMLVDIVGVLPLVEADPVVVLALGASKEDVDSVGAGDEEANLDIKTG